MDFDGVARADARVADIKRKGQDASRRQFVVTARRPEEARRRLEREVPANFRKE